MTLGDNMFSVNGFSAPEEIAYRSGWITTEELLESAKMYGKFIYDLHLVFVSEERIRHLK